MAGGRMVPQAAESLIDLVYDAAVEPEIWDRALVAIADELDSTSCVLVGHRDGSWSAPRFGHFGRLDPELNIRGSRDEFGGSPLMPRLGTLGVGQIASSDAIMPLAEALRTAWYREMMTPQDIAHCLLTPILRDHRTLCAFFVARGTDRGAFADAEIERLERLVPHLRRGAQIRCRLDAYHALSGNHQNLLDLIDIGIVLVDETGAAHCANRAAEDVVGRADGLKLRGPTLSALDHGTGVELHRHIAATAAGGPGATVAVPRRDGGEPLLVLVCPLRGTIRDRLGTSRQPRAAVALFIRDPARVGAAELDDVLRQFYRLTPGEARVATTLAAGHGIAGTARSLVLSENTVKMHAKRVYEKIGLASQVELAQFFGRLATPVRTGGSAATAA